VPNGVPLATYAFAERILPDAPLTFLGRIEEIKGPHCAIEVACRAGRKLILAGNVPLEHRPWFEARIAPHVDGDRIRYIGPVDDAQKSALLGASCALLMPILWEEPFGIVMAEAMACGTPVIGFRRGSVPEVVADGQTGFVVDTIEEMVVAIERISCISRAVCRARTESLYSDEVVTDGYLRIYEQLIARMRRNAASTATRGAAVQ
jgi:glycosyltransferase involved in cell wall biosynthesis